VTRRVDVGVFDAEARLLAAVRECRARGLEIVDVRSPYPIHGIDEPAGVRRSRIAAATLVAGLFGFGLGTWLQAWTSATDWPLDVGGKPWDSQPAFLPVTFELTVLCAGLATVAALLLRSRLRPGRAPSFPDLGVTDDRFALVVASPQGAHTTREMEDLWARLGAVRTLSEEAQP
jgi:hypothetical protein